MTRLLFATVAFGLAASTAAAEPKKLTDDAMDGVAAGFMGFLHPITVAPEVAVDLPSVSIITQTITSAQAPVATVLSLPFGGEAGAGIDVGSMLGNDASLTDLGLAGGAPAAPAP